MKGPMARVTLAASMLLLALSMAPAVAGYDGEIASHVGVSGACPAPTSATVTTALAAPTNALVSATVVDNGGNPIPGVEVVFSVDGVVLATATTDQNGRAAAGLPLPPGDTLVQANVGTIEGRAVVICPAGGVGGVIGMPRTDTAPPGVPLWLLLVGAAASLFSAFALRRAAR